MNTAIASNAVRRRGRMNHLGDMLGDFRGELMTLGSAAVGAKAGQRVASLLSQVSDWLSTD